MLHLLVDLDHKFTSSPKCEPSISFGPQTQRGNINRGKERKERKPPLASLTVIVFGFGAGGPVDYLQGCVKAVLQC